MCKFIYDLMLFTYELTNTQCFFTLKNMYIWNEAKFFLYSLLKKWPYSKFMQ